MEYAVCLFINFLSLDHDYYEEEFAERKTYWWSDRRSFSSRYARSFVIDHTFHTFTKDERDRNWSIIGRVSTTRLASYTLPKNKL